MTVASTSTRGLHGRVVVERGEFRLDVEIDVRPGEVVAVLGPNGAGKSTLLRAICGLTPLTHGAISLGDTVLDDPTADVLVPAARRRVGVVFQEYRLFPHLSVLDNVAFGPRSTGRSKAESRVDAAEWVARLRLGDLAARSPEQLSGGQQQRTALARALASGPGVLLLDEPLAALDAATRIDVRRDLGTHLADFAGPTVLVTHDALDALVLADRIVVLENGGITQQGTALEVARRPASDYVAKLLGLNLLRGDAAGGEVRVEGGGVLHVPDHVVTGPVLVALRPSAIALHTAPPEGSARNVWTGVVDGVETLGERVRVSVVGSPSVLVDVTPGAVADLHVVPGDAVWLSAKATELEVYPG
jgi:molybdate transport system ATP-binding protein